jgi:hypothetical protein
MSFIRYSSMSIFGYNSVSFFRYSSIPICRYSSMSYNIMSICSNRSFPICTVGREALFYHKTQQHTYIRRYFELYTSTKRGWTRHFCSNHSLKYCAVIIQVVSNYS